MLPIDELIRKADTTAATLDNLIPEIWEPRIEQNLRKMAVFERTATEFTGLLSQPGDVLHVPNLADLGAASALTDDTDLTMTTLNSPTLTDFTPSEYGQAVTITEKALNRVNYDMLAWIVDSLTYSMSQKIEGDFSGLYSGITTNKVGVNSHSGDTIVAGDILDAVTIRKAVQKLLEKNADGFPDGNFYLFISPKQFTDLFADSDIKNALQYGRPDQLFSANLTEYHRARIVVTNYVPAVNNAGSVPVYKAILVAPRWAGIAYKYRPKIYRDPLKDFGRKIPLAVKADFQLKLLHEDRAVLVESA